MLLHDSDHSNKGTNMNTYEKRRTWSVYHLCRTRKCACVSNHCIHHTRIVGEITFTDSHLLYSRICFKPDTFFMQIGVELIPAYCLN